LRVESISVVHERPWALSSTLPRKGAQLSHLSEEADQEVVVPACVLDLTSDRSLVGVGAKQVEGQFSQDGQVLWSVALAVSGPVFVEDHV
jgi:hypothetical protein